MRFAPTDEQIEFAQTVRSVLEDRCTPADVRRAWGGPLGTADAGSVPGRVEGAWDALVDLGANGILVPESCGGLGLGDDHLVLLVRECGRAALPDPFAGSAGVAAALLRQLGSEQPAEASRRWLEAVASGARVGVGFGPRPLVPGAADHDWLLLIDGARVVLVEPGGAELERLESVDGSRELCRVIRVEDPDLELEGEPASRLGTAALDRASVLVAAELIGLCDRMLEITCEYAAERHQFGAAIGSFQAVKHQLADAAMAKEFAEPLVMWAADRLTEGDAAVPASMAALRASGAADRVGRVALQCHGAIGYTVEHDLHLYLKRSWALRRMYGGDDRHRRTVRESLLGR